MQNELYEAQSLSKFFRKKSVEKIREELINFKNQWKGEYVFFWADTFLAWTMEELEEFCEMYSDFKKDLGNEMVDYLHPIQKKYSEIIEDKEYLNSVFNDGAEEAFYRARKTLSKVYRKVGFISKQFKF